MRRLSALLCVSAFSMGSFTLSGCGGGAASIPPDSKSGLDATWRAPMALEIDADTLIGEGGDSVSYKRGDRTDWWRFKSPKEGSLTFTLKVRPDSSGGDIQFKVLDAYYNVIATGKGAAGTSKTATVKNAYAERIYVAVYAPGAKDGGGYSLKVRLKPAPPQIVVATVETHAEDVPIPPTLPAVPGADTKGAPPKKNSCPPGGCKKTTTAAPEKAPPAEKTKSVKARIIDIGAGGSGTIVTVDKGEGAGLTNGAKGTIISKSGQALSGGTVTLTSVGPSTSRGSTSASIDLIGDAPTVVFKIAPAAAGDAGGGE